MFNYEYNGIYFNHTLGNHTISINDIYGNSQDTYELFFLFKGIANISVSSEVTQINEGEIAILLPEMKDLTIKPLSDTIDYYTISFKKENIPEFILKQINSQQFFCGQLMHSFFLFNQFEYFYINFNDEEKTIMFPQVLNTILIMIFKKDDNTNKKNESTVLEEIDTYIDSHIKEDISMKKLCDYFHFSRSYLSKIFSNYKSISIMEYVKFKKIISIHQELQTKKMPLEELSEMYGFTNYSTFYRNYVRVFHDSPKNGTKKIARKKK